MPTSKTFDANDELISYTEDPLQVTISWEDSRTEYGAGLKAAVHMRVPLIGGADVDAEVSSTFDRAKQLVSGALSGAPAPTAKVATPSVKKAPAAKGYTKPTAERTLEAWADLEANPDGWFDNRTDKRNPKAPDFKGKDKNTAFAGFGLWNDSKPF